MLVNGNHYRTVWLETGKDGKTAIVKMINQPLIPHSFEIVELRSYEEVAEAIKNMIVRGAPAIGATGGFGMALAGLSAERDVFLEYLENAAKVLRNTRPTAQDLFYAIDRVLNAVKNIIDIEKARQVAVKNAQDIADESVNACKKIGEHGAELINKIAEKKDNKTCNILTHCNAGWLACVDWGTALSPIYAVKRKYKNIKLFVFVDETRPRCQGSRLTAWELGQEGINHAIIADNAAGHYMKKDIDMVIVGADRIAANGDVANKIGTYEKAIIAKENGIPFYVAAPLSTFDVNCKTGDDIPIEERNENEVLNMFGWSEGKFTKVRIAPKASKAKNPAFDVTPARFITGIITPFGVVNANKEEIKKLFD